MKKTLALAVSASLVALLALQAEGASLYRSTVSATSTASTVTFGARALSLELFNFGTSAAYVDLDGGTAISTSTATVRIGPCDGKVLSWQRTATSGPASISVVTASGETTSLDVTAYFMQTSENSGSSEFSRYFVGHQSCAGALSTTLAGTHGESVVYGQTTESITLDTGGATTDSAANMLPANSVIDGVVCAVTTTIGTATDWKVGDGTTAGRFAAANATVTAGATSVGLVHMFGNVSTTAAGPTQAAAAKLRITTTGTPDAGVVRCTTFWHTFTAPTS